MKELKNIEPNFKEKPIEWVAWNVKTTGDSFETALTLLKTKTMVK